MLPRWHPQYWLIRYPAVEAALELAGFLAVGLPLWIAAVALMAARDCWRLVRALSGSGTSFGDQDGGVRSQLLFEQPESQSSSDLDNRPEDANRRLKVTREPTHVLITGATSGIGDALAREYARPGVTLSLVGRNPGISNLHFAYQLPSLCLHLHAYHNRAHAPRAGRV